MHNYSKLKHLFSYCKCLTSLHQLHAHLLTNGTLSIPSIASLLITSYSHLQPHSVLPIFNSIPYPSISFCNSLIRSLTRESQPKIAIRLYHYMHHLGVQPDKYTFTFVLKACADDLDSRNADFVYEEIKCRGLTTDLFICTALVDLYSKLGMVSTAREVFDKMPVVDAITWNAMIAGFSRGNAPYEAVNLFRRMQAAGEVPNSVTVFNLFPAICQLSALILCEEIHVFSLKRCFLGSIFHGLLDAYCKCGHPKIARKVFDEMSGARDDVSWGTMISGYVHNGYYTQALELFDTMRISNVKLNPVAVLGALIAAGEIADLETGIDIHDYVVRNGMKFDLRLNTALVIMYAKCGVTEKAKLLFENIRGKDVVAWSAIISSFAQNGNPKQALLSLKEMQAQGVKPNTITFLGALPACAELLDLRVGKSIHCFVLKSDMISGGTVGPALVSMYAKCKSFDLAHAMFDRLRNKDVCAWNSLINAYAQVDKPVEALRLFHRLRLTRRNPDHATFVGVLPAYALLSALKEGASVHGMTIKYGLHSDLRVKNATLDLYSKCGDVQSSHKLFVEAKSCRDIVSWNTMIAGYMHNVQAKGAMVIFRQMMAEYIKPNIVSLVSIIPATAHLISLKSGVALHCYVVKSGFESDAKVGNCLIDMYSKCGRLECAQKVFDQMPQKDTASWNTMLAGYSIHGLSHDAISLFSQMENKSIEADALTYLGVLSACRHGGLVTKGREIFESMRHKNGSGHNVEHYACMVDLLGRAGELDEAWRLIQKMPMEPDASVWGALLGACSMHSNSKLGEVALQHLSRLQPKNGAHFVVLSSIYAETGRWSDAGNMRVAMNSTGLDKTPGCSW
ncbi:pentatricopeptide repeat-containing protein At2g39620-like [Carex rostrata]